MREVDCNQNIQWQSSTINRFLKRPFQKIAVFCHRCHYFWCKCQRREVTVVGQLNYWVMNNGKKMFQIIRLASQKSEPNFLSLRIRIELWLLFTSLFSILSQFNFSNLASPSGTENLFISPFCCRYLQFNSGNCADSNYHIFNVKCGFLCSKTADIS